MSRSRRSFAFVLLFSSSLFASASAFADDQTANDTVVALVKKAFLAPYRTYESERSKYSRMAMPPLERRSKITGTGVDADGKAFASFAIEQRNYDNKWASAQMSGCAYVDSGEVFVKRGDKLRPAAAYLGVTAKDKPADARATACVAAPPAPHV